MDSFRVSTFLSPKYLLTFSIFFCYFSNALNFSLLGPTINSLSQLYGIPIEQMSLIYTIRTFSYTIGALSGFGFKYVNRQICLIVFTTIMGITLGLMPTVKSLPIFFVVGGLNGLMAGGSDTAITAWIIEIWDEKSGPFMNALHFAFGSGSFLAPLIARPFLSEEKWHNISYAYIICGAICLFSGLVLSLVLFGHKLRYNGVNQEEVVTPQNPPHAPSFSEEIVQESERRELRPRLGVIIAIMGCLLLATYVAMEMTYFSFESTFVQYSRYNMSEADAAILTSTTSAVFTLTRVKPLSADCPALSPPVNGGLDRNCGTTVGNVCRIYCRKSCKLVGDRIRVCLANNTWSGFPTQCVNKKIRCPRPLNPPTNGYKVGDCRNKVGCVCRFGCNSGYTLIGSPQVVCQPSGQWSTRPTCVALTTITTTTTTTESCDTTTDEDENSQPYCPALNVPTNGQFSGSCSVSAPGSICRFACNTGYQLVGNSVRVCQKSGKWTATTVSCTRSRITCPQLAPPRNGALIGYCAPGSPGLECDAVCNKGYTLVGTSALTCQSSGQWSASVPVCVRN